MIRNNYDQQTRKEKTMNELNELLNGNVRESIEDTFSDYYIPDNERELVSYEEELVFE